MSVDNNNQQEQLEAIEAEAREMGWVPQDEWSGNPEEWRDANEFVERGRNILPIVRANNKKLQKDLLTSNQKVASLEETLKATQQAVEALRKGFDEETKRQVEDAKKELRQQIKNAREVGDVDTEFELQDRLDSLRQSETVSKETEKATPESKKQGPQLHPLFLAWQEENPWFGDESSLENFQRSQALIWIGKQLRQQGETAEGREFMDKCMSQLEKQEGKSSSPRVSKVEPGRHGHTGGRRAFDTLPKEAQDVCHSDSNTFVGPGKKFKTTKEWEDHFAELYLAQG